MKTQILLAAAAAVALGACSEGAPGSDAAFGARVRAYLLEHPEVLEEAITKLEEKRSAQASAAASRARPASPLAS